MHLDQYSVSPQASIKLLKDIQFNPKEDDLLSLKKQMSEGYGKLICLNKKQKLFLQYHGKYETFLIGLGINPTNSHQPDVKLLRIDLDLEETHKLKEFKGKKPKSTHIHWYEGSDPIYITLLKPCDEFEMLDQILTRKII